MTAFKIVNEVLERHSGAAKAWSSVHHFGIADNQGTLTHPDGTRESVPTERGTWAAFYEQVADAILDGASVPVDPADARDGLMIIDLARRASAEGRRLPVPPPAASSLEA